MLQPELEYNKYSYNAYKWFLTYLMTAVRRYTTAETNAAAQQLYLQEPSPQIMD